MSAENKGTHSYAFVRVLAFTAFPLSSTYIVQSTTTRARLSAYGVLLARLIFAITLACQERTGQGYRKILPTAATPYAS